MRMECLRLAYNKDKDVAEAIREASAMFDFVTKTTDAPSRPQGTPRRCPEAISDLPVGALGIDSQ